MDELLSDWADGCSDTVSMRLHGIARIEKLTEFGFGDSLSDDPGKVHPHR
jgi:hypothetical protein